MVDAKATLIVVNVGESHRAQWVSIGFETFCVCDSGHKFEALLLTE